MPKYISGRFKKTPQSALPADRYRYLSVGDAEPNLGDTPGNTGSPNLPVGQQYIVVSFIDRPGERFWVPKGGGIIPGSLSIFEEGALVGGPNSTTQLNFVGNAITADGESGPPAGVAVTVTVAPPGLDNSVLFKNSGDFATDTRLTFDDGLFSVEDRITVGTDGTVITTTGIGSVGIGTTTPTQKLHLDGNFRITGTIYDSLNQPGSQGDLLIKGADENLIWVNQNAVTSGAGGEIGQIQFHSTAGVVDGADNFYFDFNNNRVGIGSTQPTQLLDVLGVSLFTGDVNFIGDNYNLLWDKSQDSLEFEDETKITFGNGRDLQIFHTDSLSSQTDSNGDSIVDGRTSLIEERGSGGLIFKSNGGDGPGAYQFFDQNWQPLLKLHGGTNARALLFHNGVERIETTGYGVTINGGLVVSGIATIQTLNLQDLSVPGISTLGNVVVSTNTISTKSGTGNLILDADASVQINDPVIVLGATESTGKDSGSIITEGGIGVEKSINIGLNLNVGGAVSFTGPSVGIAVTLAGAGGITTTGGDLYVNGNVLPSHNATSNNDSSGKDIGASNINWRRVYAQEFVGAFIGIADKANNLAGGAAGSIPYQSAPDTTVFLAEPNADNKVLSYNNTSDAPIWIDLDKIQEGNTKAEVVDTGNNGYFTVETEGSEKFRVLSNGNVNFYDGGTQYYGSISKTSSGSFELLGYTNLDLVADGTRISIDQIGVGINSTQPTAELDVNGKVALGSSVYDSNGSTGSNQQILSSAPGIGVSWASIQDIAISVDKIQEDNTSAEVVDTGTDGHFKVLTEGAERFRIGPAGIATFFGNGTATIASPNDLNLNANTVAISTDITIGGKIGLGNPVDYGSAGEVLTSNGGSSPPTWQSSSGGGGVQDKIQEDNTSAEVVDTGTNGHFKVLTEGTERFRIGPAGIATFINEIHGNGQRLGSYNSSGRFSGLSVTDGESYYGNNKLFTSSSNEFGLRAFANNSAYLKSNSGGFGGGNVYLQSYNTTSGGYLIAKGTDSVELHHSGTNNKKLATTDAGITVTGISSATEGFDFEVQSGGTPVTTNSVKILNFSGTNNTITYDASTKTVDIDIDSGSGSGGVQDKIQENNTSAEVVDTGTNGHFKVLTENVERLRIIANGNVGIGTTSPVAPLDVVDGLRVTGGITTITGTDIHVNSPHISSSCLLIAGGADGGMSRLDTTANLTWDPLNQRLKTESLKIDQHIYAGITNLGLGGTTGTNGQVLTSTGVGVTWSDPTGGSGGVGISSDRIKEGNTLAEVVDTNGDGHFKVETEGTERFRIGPAGIATFFGNGTANIASPSDLTFSTNDTERLRISSAGNVGIGTDDPIYKLDLLGINVLANIKSTNNNYVLQFAGNNCPYDVYVGTDNANNFLFANDNNDGTFSERLRIGSAGQIGLGGANYGSSGQVLTSNGSSSAPTWQTVSGGGGVQDKIQENNTSAEVVDTGTNGHFKVLTDGTEKFRIGPAGIATFTADIAADSGNPGQINIDPTTSTSNGRIRYSGTKTFMIEGGSNSDNKIEIHGHQNSLNILCEGQGETELYFNGNKKLATTGAGITVTGISSASDGFDFEVESSGSLVTTNSVKTLNFTGNNNTITYNASTKTVDIDIDGSSGSGGGTVVSGTFTATAGSPSTLNTYAYDSAELVFEYTVFVKNGSDYQSQKLLVMRDGTTVHSTQYGVMYSNNLLVELDATISGSNLLLRATPETGVNGSTTYRLKREVV